mmetsp:Transcript_31712/g.80095  ORF Transcript_31712/g.80095 Transcript_31712/m.80095 type:complete len:274 (-) Transcript_31712:532-1353(-)
MPSWSSPCKALGSAHLSTTTPEAIELRAMCAQSAPRTIQLSNACSSWRTLLNLHKASLGGQLTRFHLLYKSLHGQNGRTSMTNGSDGYPHEIHRSDMMSPATLLVDRAKTMVVAAIAERDSRHSWYASADNSDKAPSARLSAQEGGRVVATDVSSQSSCRLSSRASNLRTLTWQPWMVWISPSAIIASASSGLSMMTKPMPEGRTRTGNAGRGAFSGLLCMFDSATRFTGPNLEQYSCSSSGDLKPSLWIWRKWTTQEASSCSMSRKCVAITS